MTDLEKKVSDFISGINVDGTPITIGQTIAHFISEGYDKEDVCSALSAFSKNRIAKTTEECN